MGWVAHARSQAWESGLTCSAVATIIFSLSALQVKLTGGRVPVLELCVIRSSISWGTSISVGAVSKISPLFGHRRHLPLLIFRGLFGTAAIACSYAALLNLPLGDAVTLAQLRPPVMAVMGYLLLNEPLGWAGAAGCLISLVGAVILSHPPFLFGGHAQWSKRRLLGTVYGVASPCFGAGVGYCIRRIQRAEPALVVALWFHTVTVGLLVWPLLAGWPDAAVMVEGRDAALLLGISCSSFCAQLLMTRAFQLLPAARAASLNFLGVVYSHVLGALVFGEKTTLYTLGGGLLIFVGVLMVAWRPPGSSSSNRSSSSDKPGASSNPSDVGGGSSRYVGVPDEDNEATVLLKGPDSSHQPADQPHHTVGSQQQQQWGGPDDAARDVSDQSLQQHAAPSQQLAATSHREQQAASARDVELGAVTATAGGSRGSGQRDGAGGGNSGSGSGGTEQQQQQLQPLLHGGERSIAPAAGIALAQSRGQ